jgi:hypothetical protein
MPSPSPRRPRSSLSKPAPPASRPGRGETSCRLRYVTLSLSGHICYVTTGDPPRMPKTNAERQQAWRQRRDTRIAALEAEAAQLRAGDDALRADLDAALAECERLAANQCKHPSGAIDSDHFRACGTNLW